MNNANFLGEESVSKLLLKFSIPAIVGMLVNALYNVVDRIFIGHGVGYLGLAGITISFPIMLVIMAFSMLIGIGATSLISIRLGQQRKEEAELILGNALILLILFSILLTIVGLTFMNPLLRSFGASQSVLPYATDYLSIILWGAIFQSIGFGMNNFIRAEGNPNIAMFTMLIGAILNAIFNPIFIFGFNWGIKGSAFATILSQFISAAWVLYHFLGGRSTLKIKLSNLKLKAATVRLIITLGMAPFAMQMASSLLNVIMNKSLESYGGDVAISGMGLVMSIMMLVLMPIFGINQGIQPIIGYNYGARKYERVKEALKLGIMTATAFVIVGFIAIQAFPTQFITIFNNEDAELITFGSSALRIFTICLPIIGFQIVSANYFQAVGKPRQAAFLSLSRQVLVLIPALLILPNFYGLTGVIMAGPFSDLVSSIVTGLFLYLELKKLNSPQEGLIS